MTATPPLPIKPLPDQIIHKEEAEMLPAVFTRSGDDG